MGATYAAPNDLKDPEEKLAVYENHDADVRNAGQTTSAGSHRSQASTYAHSDIEGGDSEKAERRSLSAVDEEKQQEAPDPNIVDWDGPDDPEKPTNWPAGRKYGIVILISFITFLT